jgi:hypothetical protein
MVVDITDLLKVDDRLSYGWREADVDNGNLHIKFPHVGEYRITDGSKVEEGTWYLQIEHHWGLHPAMIDEQHHRIPEGVEKIVIGEIVEINKEKYTTNFIDVLNESDPDQVYPVMVMVKPDNEDEFERMIEDMKGDRQSRIEAMNKAYEGTDKALHEYLDGHAVGNVNYLSPLHGAIFRMKTSDILELSKQDYIKRLDRGDK